MPAPEGNRFWEARATSGAPPKYANGEDLWAACVEYFEWVDDNPLMSLEKVTFQGVGTLMEVPKMRAMSLKGLCGFLDISFQTWVNWGESRKDLFDIVTRVENIIYQQKFEGAAADLLNPSIIARELGLADNNNVRVEDKREPDTTAIDAIKAAIVAKMESDE